jgi:hypothetical protein
MKSVSKGNLEVTKDGKKAGCDSLVPGITPNNVLVELGFEEGLYGSQSRSSKVCQHEEWAIDSSKLVVLYFTA